MAANNSFRATDVGTCRKCTKEIVPGDLIVKFNRPEPNSLFHVDCSNPTGETVPTPTVVPNADQIMRMLAEVMQGMRPMATSNPEVLTSSSPIVSASTPVETVKPAVNPTVKAPRLDDRILIEGTWEQKAAMLSPHFGRILAVGLHGTGKSTYLSSLRPDSIRVTCHEDLTSGTLQGQWHLRNKETIFLDGIGTTALRKGQLIVFDEWERAGMECRSLFYDLFDSPAHTTLPTGENVQAAKGYSVICTSNEDPEAIPAPILDRMEIVLFADEPTSGILSTLHPEILPVTVQSYRSQAKQRKAYKPTVSARTSIVYTKLRNLGVSQEAALHLVYHAAAKEVASAMATAAGAL